MIQKNDIILVIVKKILSLLLILGAFVAAVAADDSYLYWMVTADDYTPGTDYTSVKIAVKDNSGAVSYLTSYSCGDGAAISGDSVSSAITSAYASQGMGLYAALGSYASASYSFAIELFNEGGYVAQSNVADGGWVNFSSLAQYIINSPMATPVATWAPSSYAVPEPSSGLLMLLGGALLALRRRKPKLA